MESVADEIGLRAQIKRYDNPRTEQEEHYYQPDREHLLGLGYQPTRDMRAVVRTMLLNLQEHRKRIEAHADMLIPDIRWDGGRRRSEVIA